MSGQPEALKYHGKMVGSSGLLAMLLDSEPPLCLDLVLLLSSPISSAARDQLPSKPPLQTSQTGPSLSLSSVPLALHSAPPVHSDPGLLTQVPGNLGFGAGSRAL